MKLLLILLTLSQPIIVCPGDITRYNDQNQRYATIIITPAVAHDDSGSLTVIGARSDNLPLTNPFPLGHTSILWKASNPDGVASCAQTIIVMQVGSGKRRIRRNP